MKTTASSQPPTANPPNPESARLVGLAPVFDARARVLVLGSFPGAASLKAAQYYAHPRNAFWPVMAALLGEAALPQQPYEQRLQALRRGRVALWDAVAACRREGSLDTAIEDAEPSDVAELVARLPQLRAIACNGGLAHGQALRALGAPGLPVLRLPSTSPAHAGLSLAAKIAAWREALAPCLG
ncbi:MULTISPECIES: DNA-deoxyinosine glycosylase [Roseateles]|uniref:DNA-deoxyinosine glycosylase n=1 Tax=Pelomonas caseinilytica TaxID=2906763 RepID=A0ABS8X9Z6_9BURK|nr:MULTISPECIES: DNA-deoxyinosine glycosylase [unclassified Roseateles]MCE4537707.1 DNA-deoxyinosine glycosylase [Pelomonas sp. P7]HEV6966735.1 DNA-deoxyinosine glycosylase [Roseateles sp.]